MPYDPQKHHRHSIRLKGYDYTEPGAYFITICTKGRQCLFGNVVNGEMQLNYLGYIACLPLTLYERVLSQYFIYLVYQPYFINDSCYYTQVI
jgi:hypothetical protein